MDWRRRARALWVAWGAAAAAAAVLAAVDPPWLDRLILPAALACLGAAIAEQAISRWADRRDGRHHRRARPRRDLTWWERNRDALTSERRRSLGPAAAVVGAGSAFLPQSTGPRMQLVWLVAGLAAVVYAADVRLEEVAWRRERMAERKRERLVSGPDDLRLPAPTSWDDGADLTPAQAAQWDAFVQRAAGARHEAHDDFALLDDDVRRTFDSAIGGGPSMVNRLRPRTLWMGWAALSGGAVVMALVNPPWLAMGLVVVALVGLQLLDTGRVPNRVSPRSTAGARPLPHPATVTDGPRRTAIHREHRASVCAVDRRRWNHVLSAGLAASGGAGLLLAIVNPASLPLSRAEIVGYGLLLLVTAGLVGLVDPTALAQRSRRRLMEPAPIGPTQEPPAPRPDRAETYAELWDEEPELPAAEAARWDSFVDRAAEVNHSANDDLTQIDGWYEAPPPPRHRHRRPPP